MRMTIKKGLFKNPAKIITFNNKNMKKIKIPIFFFITVSFIILKTKYVTPPM